jgi:hypothetical protein
MPRKRRNSTSDAWGFAMLGFEAWNVIGLRMAKMAAGGMPAVLEAQRMVMEKQMAAVESHTAAAIALSLGHGHEVAARAAMKPYRIRVRANRRRLSGG